MPNRLLTVSIKVNSALQTAIRAVELGSRTMWNFWNWLCGSGADSTGGKG
jgi:hypothetical protein